MAASASELRGVNLYFIFAVFFSFELVTNSSLDNILYMLLVIIAENIVY
jgi:hypothetical protein